MIKDYDRLAAVSYALKWALGRNPDFYDYNSIGGDCTNFVSQCVYAGTQTMNYTPEFGWYYINGNEKSPSWTGVEFFYDFMINNEGIGPFGEARNINLLVPGDIIQLGNREGDFYHSLILTRIDYSFRRRRFYVCAHSEDAFQRNLLSYNFSNIRGIHILGYRTE